MEPSSVEIRVLGCLIEKQRTTPDAYPLTRNALRLACNQSTNRDPILELDDATIRDALERLTRRRWARLASGQGSRAPKYRDLLSEALGLADDELWLLAVLMLRGAADPGRAQNTRRAPPPLRRPRVRRGRARAAGRARTCAPARAPARAEGRALRADPRRRGGRACGRPAGGSAGACRRRPRSRDTDRRGRGRAAGVCLRSSGASARSKRRSPRCALRSSASSGGSRAREQSRSEWLRE
jgi:Protein of unknown function, DUF480